MTDKKVFVHTVLIIFFVSIFLGCAGEEKPKTEGKDLYDYITEKKDYKKWKLWPGKGEFYQGTEPHGVLLTTYVTDNAVSAIEGKKGSIPDGSIIVKENYNPEKQLESVTVMYKVKDYDPENNNWFWAKYSPDGNIDAEGKVEGCINCHGQVKDNDYLFTGDLK